ncbi:hypothetical protein AB1L88_10165 [Tautonia sp. JC769]|uniref:hypothetical protein n=1 Tax=Tautonia sp. JC769 TaxID=3232135 RepID=UPI003457EC94
MWKIFTNRPRRPSKGSRRPTLERLDDRLVLSVTVPTLAEAQPEAVQAAIPEAPAETRTTISLQRARQVVGTDVEDLRVEQFRRTIDQFHSSYLRQIDHFNRTFAQQQDQFRRIYLRGVRAFGPDEVGPFQERFSTAVDRFRDQFLRRVDQVNEHYADAYTRFGNRLSRFGLIPNASLAHTAGTPGRLALAASQTGTARQLGFGGFDFGGAYDTFGSAFAGFGSNLAGLYNDSFGYYGDLYNTGFDDYYDSGYLDPDGYETGFNTAFNTGFDTYGGIYTGALNDYYNSYNTFYSDYGLGIPSIDYGYPGYGLRSGFAF